ncbi:hypothetical protein A0128_11620 [Leptospira tipperaryensis]|uniref:Uncharacterized protein n=1 Tax=Leptospira tipperaryensis TaxID=2564040 RepID=A0A1D7UXW7_9LEPT|nr:hypothetical protein A0128_11620 [Leptospira tipperaryensis]
MRRLLLQICRSSDFFRESFVPHPNLGWWGEAVGRIGKFFFITEMRFFQEKISLRVVVGIPTETFHFKEKSFRRAGEICRSSDFFRESFVPHPNLGWWGEAVGRIGRFFSITEMRFFQEEFFFPDLVGVPTCS